MQFPLELQLYGVKAQQIFTYWKQFKRSTYTHLKDRGFINIWNYCSFGNNCVINNEKQKHVGLKDSFLRCKELKNRNGNPNIKIIKTWIVQDFCELKKLNRFNW